MSKHLKLPTLLVIAENPSVHFWMKKHLDDQFFIIRAVKWQEALDALNARLDFIVVDASIEEYDALALCREISQLTRSHFVPILLITGRLKKTFRDRALESGVTDFLSDQLDVEELQARIATGLKTASAREKAENLGLLIQVPKIAPNGSLKKKSVVKKKGNR